MPHFETSDGLTLYYSDEGQGIPILCLAGLTRNSSDFSYINGKLGEVRLLKMDYRGRGKSDWAKDFTTYNIPRESQDALELMDFLGIKKFAIIGTSRGGLCAITIGAMAPDRLLGVAFNDIGPDLNLEGLKVIMNYIGQNPPWQTMAQATEARHSVMAGFENVPQSRWREEVEKFYHQTEKGLVINYDPKLRDSVLAVPLDSAPDLWPFFKALSNLPLAVLRGENSDLLAADTFQKMRIALPQAIMATVKDRGHVPFLDEPESLETLQNWVTQLEQAPQNQGA
ncbi:alpha/beta hydrolase [Cognatishimia sp. WU-CL00825]|uniref:alpha/beta fold hydrolase n=1 Tax=Cognatishimia sp. WU-CL00825 TaxID=3127658 RepID=UPI00310A78A5